MALYTALDIEGCISVWEVEVLGPRDTVVREGIGMVRCGIIEL